MQPVAQGSNLDPFAASSGNPKVEIRLNADHFKLLCNVLGATTQGSQATLIGLGWRAISRARKGKPCGERFVANALHAFEQHADTFAERNLPITFDAIFTKTVTGTKSAA